MTSDEKADIPSALMHLFIEQVCCFRVRSLQPPLTAKFWLTNVAETVVHNVEWGRHPPARLRSLSSGFPGSPHTVI